MSGLSRVLAVGGDKVVNSGTSLTRGGDVATGRDHLDRWLTKFEESTSVRLTTHGAIIGGQLCITTSPTSTLGAAWKPVGMSGMRTPKSVQPPWTNRVHSQGRGQVDATDILASAATIASRGPSRSGPRGHTASRPRQRCASRPSWMTAHDGSYSSRTTSNRAAGSLGSSAEQRHPSTERTVMAARRLAPPDEIFPRNRPQGRGDSSARRRQPSTAIRARCPSRERVQSQFRTMWYERSLCVHGEVGKRGTVRIHHRGQVLWFQIRSSTTCGLTDINK